MTSELGLILLRTVLIINIFTYSNSSVKSTIIIRQSKQNDLIDVPTTTTTTESVIDSISTEELLSISSQTHSSSTSTELPTTSTSDIIIDTTTATSDEIKKSTPEPLQEQQQQPQQQQQQPLYPWNSMWNTAQSIWSFIPPNWLSYIPNQQQQQQSLFTSSNIQATPVASITLTFGKTTINKPSSTSNNNISGSSGGSGFLNFGCPPPIVISGVCPESTCNCQCDNNNKNKKIIPVVQETQKNITASKLSVSSSISSQGQHQQQQTKQQQQQQPIKFILPFQSWQDFFLKPVQLISNRVIGRSITFVKGDQKHVEKINGKQSSKIIPDI